jgi:hypothetical protein
MAATIAAVCIRSAPRRCYAFVTLRQTKAARKHDVGAEFREAFTRAHLEPLRAGDLQGWSGRRVSQEAASGILIAALGMLEAYYARGRRAH